MAEFQAFSVHDTVNVRVPNKLVFFLKSTQHVRNIQSVDQTYNVPDLAKLWYHSNIAALSSAKRVRIGAFAALIKNIYLLEMLIVFLYFLNSGWPSPCLQRFPDMIGRNHLWCIRMRDLTQVMEKLCL
jgi:hypothetical protein